MANSGSGSNRLTRSGTRGDSDILSMAEGPDGFRRRSRTLKSGAVRHKYTVEIESEEILFEWNELQLGKGPAEAIKAEMEADFAAITETISPDTAAFRGRAKEALTRGARWAKKRYAGGRTGEKAPTGGNKLLIDSGRLSEGLAVRENKADESWTVNVPANRLNPNTFSPQEFREYLRLFRKLIPSMNPRTLVARPRFQKSIDDAISDKLVQAIKRGASLRSQRLSMLGRGLAGAARALILP